VLPDINIEGAGYFRAHDQCLADEQLAAQHVEFSSPGRSS
jgi:hypothetical protein